MGSDIHSTDAAIVPVFEPMHVCEPSFNVDKYGILKALLYTKSSYWHLSLCWKLSWFREQNSKVSTRMFYHKPWFLQTKCSLFHWISAALHCNTDFLCLIAHHVYCNMCSCYNLEPSKVSCCCLWSLDVHFHNTTLFTLLVVNDDVCILLHQTAFTDLSYSHVQYVICSM